MKKVLFTATVDSHIMNFHTPYLKYFKDNGFEVHVASNGDEQIPSTDFKYNVPFQRSPYKKDNLKAYIEIKKILSSNNFDLIHCHTPIGAFLTRLAARKYRKFGTKVVYTAHGFHFFKGAPLINWVLFYPIEKLLSRYTDCLITMNNEDYEIAKAKFKAAEIKIINGVGVDLEKFPSQTVEEKIKLRNSYGFRFDDFILIYVGELSYRKHQDLLIRSVHILKDIIPNIKLLLVGAGDKFEEYEMMIKKLDLESNIKLLGYRNDIKFLMTLSDIAVSSSRQEGLPVNIMEAMAIGLPLIVSNSRGNRDLVIDNQNGFIFRSSDLEGMVHSITKLYESSSLRNEFAIFNNNLKNQYSLTVIKEEMSKLYKSLL